ncbi:hypothetical protein AB6889_12265 [Carnobacterium maltaromaticum]|uniref:hypothetical protein n=1 Tax=Carnobacterium maltaromaticum TaxID=2751 RepID=UPI0039BDE5DF
MEKYRKMPVVVEAVLFTTKNDIGFNEAKRFAGNCFIEHQEHYASDKKIYYIRTLEGDMKISEGDYIIKGVQGEFYPCKPDIFELTYEVAEE